MQLSNRNMTLQKLINQNQQSARKTSLIDQVVEQPKGADLPTPSKVKRVGSLVIKQQESKVTVNLNMGFLDRFEQSAIVNEIEPWAEEDGGLGYTVHDFAPDFNLQKPEKKIKKNVSLKK